MNTQERDQIANDVFNHATVNLAPTLDQAPEYTAQQNEALAAYAAIQGGTPLGEMLITAYKAGQARA